MTTPRRNWPVIFRAGAGPGEDPLPARAEAAAAAPHAAAAAAPKVLLADISEFQHDINDAAYLAWSKAIIIRAAYGAQHDDRAWFGGRRRDLLHQGGARFTGIYQYVVAGQDPARQAAALISLVGQLRPGEKLIADIEEGAGNLRETWGIWSAEVAGATGDEPWLYSGLNFAAAHNLSPVDWVAAYQAAEPRVSHLLWQFTDSFAVPGVGRADCSVFHGTIDQLAALGFGGTPAQNWTEVLVNTLPLLKQGATGEDVKTLQGLLAARGHPVRIDGAYGLMTKGQVVNFQHACGFTGADLDGAVGPKTWPKLLGR